MKLTDATGQSHCRPPECLSHHRAHVFRPPDDQAHGGSLSSFTLQIHRANFPEIFALQFHHVNPSD